VLRKPFVAKRKKKEAPPPVEAFGDKLIAKNKRASFEYELGDRFEAGLVLTGSEVKMLRHGTADLTDAWVAIERGEAYVHNVNVPEMPGTPYGHPPKRKRKLLLHREEIDALRRAVEREGMTAVALRLYFRGGRAKLEIALARVAQGARRRSRGRGRDGPPQVTHAQWVGHCPPMKGQTAA
jgi:SsrA-binding protein